jgi:hypothetical protein
MSSPTAAALAIDPVAAGSSNSFTGRLPSPRAASRLGLANRTASASALAAQEQQAASLAALLQEQQQQQQQRRHSSGGLFERLRRAVSRKDGTGSSSSKASGSSDGCSPVSSTGPSSILPFTVDAEPVARLHSGSVPYIARHLSAAGREAMLHGAEPVRSFGDHRQVPAAAQRCSSPDLAMLAGLAPAAAATAATAQLPGGAVAGGPSQGSQMAIAAPAWPQLSSSSATGAVTAEPAQHAAPCVCPASNEAAAEGEEDFQAMWQSAAAHHGLDPHLSLAHEQQLAAVTGSKKPRKKGAARRA